MEFTDNVKQFIKRIESLKDTIKTEEATKTSLVLPFFQMLGYDIFNPLEFVPEFTADVGTKKGEKVDYAIMQNSEPIIIIEVKPCTFELNNKHINQLFRYFTVTKAKFGVLTNGIIYRFYSDLDESNKMDNTHFLEINLLDIKDNAIKELKRFAKPNFDIKDILDNAEELKYTALVKKVLSEQLQNPSDQFIKAILNQGIYSGVKTQNVIDKFKTIIKGSFNEYINETINEKLQYALNNSELLDSSRDTSSQNISKIYEFTPEELDILNYIKTLITVKEEIVYKKTSGYISIQLGNNIRKWVCRVFMKQTKVFTLHKYDFEQYECEYYFDEPNQLDQIKDLIQKVAEHCSNSKI